MLVGVWVLGDCEVIWDVGEWEERVVWYVGVLEKGREMGGLNSWPRIGWFFTVRPR